MKYSDALKLIESKKTIIGKEYNGFMVNGFLMVPSNYTKRRRFFKSYFETKNAFMSIQPFKEDDLSVWAVNFRNVSQGKIDYIPLQNS